MSNLDFFVTFGLGPLAMFFAGLAVFAIARREQRLYFSRLASTERRPKAR